MATKSDLRDKADDPSRFISTNQGQALANEFKAQAFVECSALTQDGLRTVFDSAIRCVIQPGKKPKINMKKCLIL